MYHRHSPILSKESSLIMLAMAKSVNAALFGSLLVFLPLAVASIPKSANPFLIPHAQIEPPPVVVHPALKHHRAAPVHRLAEPISLEGRCSN